MKMEEKLKISREMRGERERERKSGGTMMLAKHQNKRMEKILRRRRFSVIGKKKRKRKCKGYVKKERQRVQKQRKEKQNKGFNILKIYKENI